MINGLSSHTKKSIYTYDLYDFDKEYYLLVIVKWNNKTSSAKEVSHKSYYIDKNADDIRNLLTQESFLETIYQYREYTVLKSLKVTYLINAN